MFDIAFSELIVIGVVALIAIGPDKLPKVARTAGHLFGRAQRYINDVKSEMDNELRIEELQKLQNEILENTQAAPKYQVGQVIRHGQIVRDDLLTHHDQLTHDIDENEELAAKPVHPTTMTEGDYIPTPLRSQPLNQAKAS
ncbi:Sec-independent protein translocase protein TatB [Methylotenera mobilis]|uniref:Sec-independent protein translocase protein TatB n=1 Tax=Methylotenera mobilis (strain JLW8 / ATCC BAA-1282 / DSM 17540) TaxID=583345 RepID=C6WX34_METML|nr:Sec-independent protein translocase protein TatB [Methylotenera mobilis]ACT48483.1 twin-arginine translocation protein, TatB subunit [Methylotenera mobilis JLW8]